MIRIDNLTKSFGPIVAVNGLNVEFGPGVTGLVGHNGAGKSTLLRVIAGIYPPTNGKVTIDGYEAGSKEGKAHCFFLSDNPYAPKGATIEGVLDFYMGLFEIDKEDFARIIDAFELPMGQPVNTFSKGMRRQMFIAIALAMKADHLLLDEAFDGLDPLAVDAIKGEILYAAEKGKTVVISSHNIAALQRLVDRFVILHRGKVAKEGACADFSTEFLKYQGVFARNFSQSSLESLGLDVVFFRKVGSVNHFVIYGGTDADSLIAEELKPTFLERVPLDPEELVALEMALAKKNGGSRHA